VSWSWTCEELDVAANRLGDPGARLLAINITISSIIDIIIIIIIIIIIMTILTIPSAPQVHKNGGIPDVTCMQVGDRAGAGGLRSLVCVCSLRNYLHPRWYH
jgi:hypothetical protein